MDWSRYPNFKADEFKCSHCGDNEIKEELLDKLQALRSRYGKPMRITSGYRCPRHPIEAAKSAPGPHSSGLACDVGVEGADAHKLLGLALDAGFKGIGVQQKGTGRFLHLDLVNSPNRPTVWSY
jgi:zinc D-Ala-D-Ala carboxypeptidase